MKPVAAKPTTQEVLEVYTSRTSEAFCELLNGLTVKEARQMMKDLTELSNDARKCAEHISTAFIWSSE